jgi:adenine phosphoribosyltransferase
MTEDYSERPLSDQDDSLRRLIRAVPDFPQPGIIFRDISPLLADPIAFNRAIERLSEPFSGQRIDRVAAIESRGFLFGAPLALRLGCALVPVRKLGKLPGPTVSREYSLEYGRNHLEIRSDAIAVGERVLVVDDVLATGGTACAAARIVEELGGSVVSLAFLIELSELRGRDHIEGRPVFSLLTF